MSRDDKAATVALSVEPEDPPVWNRMIAGMSGYRTRERTGFWCRTEPAGYDGGSLSTECHYGLPHLPNTFIITIAITKTGQSSAARKAGMTARRAGLPEIHHPFEIQTSAPWTAVRKSSDCGGKIPDAERCVWIGWK